MASRERQPAHRATAHVARRALATGLAAAALALVATVWAAPAPPAGLAVISCRAWGDATGCADVGLPDGTVSFPTPSIAALTHDGRDVLLVTDVAVGTSVGAARIDAAGRIGLPHRDVTECSDPTACTSNVQGVSGATALAASPDGSDVYVASPTLRGLLHLRRDAAGTLRPAAGSGQACVSLSGDYAPVFGEPALATCAAGRGLNGAASVAVSPDGRNVYVGAASGVAVFSRDAATGALSQPAGMDGCVSSDGLTDLWDPAAGLSPGTTPTCGVAAGLASPAVVPAPDGRTLYAISGAAATGSRVLGEAAAVVTLVRDPATGALSQPAGAAGCLSADGDAHIPGDTLDTLVVRGRCARGDALAGPGSLSFAADGRSAILGTQSGAAFLSRDPATGALTQLPGADGCIAGDYAGTAGAPPARCRHVAVVGSFAEVAMSPDGSRAALASTASARLPGPGLPFFQFRGATTVLLTRNAAGGYTPAGCTAAGWTDLPALTAACAVLPAEGGGVVGWTPDGARLVTFGILRDLDLRLSGKVLAVRGLGGAAGGGARRAAGVRRTGTPGRDLLRGTPGPDVLRGLGGNDVLSGLAGSDRLDGGAGRDLITGGPGRDVLVGGPGDDLINARDGARDIVTCGPGRDRALLDRVDVARGCERRR